MLYRTHRSQGSRKLKPLDKIIGFPRISSNVLRLAYRPLQILSAFGVDQTNRKTRFYGKSVSCHSKAPVPKFG